MVLERKKHKGHQRYYLQDGTYVPGASTITGVMDKGRGLLIWANRLGFDQVDVNKYVDSLADAGTLAHYLIECDMMGFERDESYLAEFTKIQMNHAETALLKYYEWRDKYEIKPIWHEEQLVSEKYRFGGTLDILAKVRDVKTNSPAWLTVLIDIKTCKSLYGPGDEKWTQVAGYDLLAEENGQKVDECRILRVGRIEEEGFEYALSPARELHRDRFLICRNLYEANRKLTKRAA